MDRSRTKRRAVFLALQHGFGLVRLEASIYAVARDGTERLVVRAAVGEDAWARALDVLEAMRPPPVICLEWGCPDRDVCGHERRADEESIAWDQHRAAMKSEDANG